MMSILARCVHDVDGSALVYLIVRGNSGAIQLETSADLLSIWR